MIWYNSWIFVIWHHSWYVGSSVVSCVSDMFRKVADTPWCPCKNHELRQCNNCGFLTREAEQKDNVTLHAGERFELSHSHRRKFHLGFVHAARQSSWDLSPRNTYSTQFVSVQSFHLEVQTCEDHTTGQTRWMLLPSTLATCSLHKGHHSHELFPNGSLSNYVQLRWWWWFCYQPLGLRTLMDTHWGQLSGPVGPASKKRISGQAQRYFRHQFLMQQLAQRTWDQRSYEAQPGP